MLEVIFAITPIFNSIYEEYKNEREKKITEVRIFLKKLSKSVTSPNFSYLLEAGVTKFN